MALITIHGYGITLIGRFYVIMKFELPKVQDLQFTTISYDKTVNI